MQKVYLLLRNNKQTGPYSLEELLQLNLKPFDLVWVDGRSAAWQYPFEIPSLKPYVPETPHAEAPFQPIATAAMEESPVVTSASHQQPQNPVPQNVPPQGAEAPKRVFVSIPKTYTAAKEQKTYAPVNEPQPNYQEGGFAQHKAYMPSVDEPVTQRTPGTNQTIPPFVKPSEKPVREELASTNYSRSLKDVEEDYTKWVYQQKTKKKATISPKDLALAVLLIAVIGGGYYIMSKPSVTSSIVAGNKTAAPITQPTEQVADETQPKEILSPDQRVVPPTTNNNVSTPVENNQPKNTKKKNHNNAAKAQTVSSVPQVQNPMPVEKTTPNIHEPKNEVIAPQPQVKQQPQQTTEKKKKLGEVLKGIFAKKEKKEEPKPEAPVSEDPKPATNRQAARRDEPAKADDNTNHSEVSSASLMEQVDLTSNAPDNWMLGVKNLKITLRNRSNVTIQSASVTVSYYDENNQLLEKKLIYFSNVAPKGRATLAAPDSKFADHVEYKLTTIAGKEDRYASN
ncbi:MAG: FxLYD domain-containing protein [Flavisolibacter sp.]